MPSSGGTMQPQQPPQQFCLRWNNYQSNLTNVFDQLLQSESFVDVTLACEGHSVKAHKMVLSACSPYFQALFFDNPCQHPIVILKDIKWPELKAAVEFMYKGEINVSQEQIGPLLKVAESLKIRGLADVGGGGSGGGGGGDPETNGSSPPHGHGGDAAGSPPSTPLPHHLHSNSGGGKKPWDLSDGGGCLSPPLPLLQRAKKRRRPSGERSSVSSPEESDLLDDMPLPTQAPSHGPTLVPDPGLPLPPPPPPPPPPQHPEDLEIKPGIAEMIREEERAKLLESSHAWLGASTSSIAADSYQYQLQSMWQKCWNTNQSLVHNLRFRERGPLKSWRPETMAEAIFSVLREGLSLSQAARKYDIPYPTFVLYANRVHNMLGPSIDGGADLRPKGRGRPQRILLGSWPEDHINGVIRAVVFRDPQHIKEEPHLSYPRLTQHTPARRSPLPTNLVSRYVSSPLAMSGFGQHIKDDPDMTYPHMGMQEPMQNYGNMNAPPPCTNGPEPTVSPGAAAAAAVAVVAQGLRQQMCSMVAAAAHHQHTGASAEAAGLVSSLGLCLPPPPASNGGVIRGSPLVSSDSPSPPHAPSPLANSLGVGIGLPSSMSYKPPPSFTSPRPETLFQEDIEEIVKSPQVGGSPENLIKDPKEIPISIKMESVVEAQNE